MTTHATTQEFLEAVARLSEQERMTLVGYAKTCLFGTHYSSGADIVHEAIYRTVEGRRPWPTDVALAHFLLGSIRSIASGAKQKADAFHLSLDEGGVPSSDWGAMRFEAAASAEDVAIANERKRMSHAAVEFARKTLAGDHEGLRVLDGMAADLSPADMREAFDLDMKTFVAARHRVVKRLRIWGERHPQ